MTRRQQINFRIPVQLLDKIKETAKFEGIDYTQWIIDACVARLGSEGGEFEYMTSDDPVANLKKSNAALWDALNYCVEKLEENSEEIDNLKDEFTGLVETVSPNVVYDTNIDSKDDDS